MATDQVSSTPGDEQISQDSDVPFSYSATSTALSRLVIALMSFSVPLVAVVTERAAGSGQLPPMAYDHGPPTAQPISLSGSDQPSDRDTGW